MLAALRSWWTRRRALRSALAELGDRETEYSAARAISARCNECGHVRMDHYAWLGDACHINPDDVQLQRADWSGCAEDGHCVCSGFQP